MNIETLKSEGRYFEAGKVAASNDWGNNTTAGRNYGVHFGMRSTRAAAITEFERGYDHQKTRLEEHNDDADWCVD